MADSFNIEFKDVVYEVVNNSRNTPAGKYLQLIHGMSGRFESGKLTAIMGPSGSCKTTFLDLLIGRVLSSSRTHGTIMFRGEQRDPMRWLSQHSYLEQDDCIVSNQTVREFITFSVLCRKKGATEKEVDHIVADVMEELQITKLADTILDSISGGERKRVMVAIEFAVSPDVLVLDEPTSGLDSHLSLQLIHMLKTYAEKHNKIVIMTIHQPGSGLFEMIDHLYFMYKGTIIYNGAVKEIDQFFQKHGFEITNSLSKPEFLFELFTEYSVFKEIRDHKSAVVGIAEEAKAQATKSVENARLTSGTNVIFDFSLCPKHIVLIFKRAMLLHVRRMSSIIGFVAINILFALVFMLWACSCSFLVISLLYKLFDRDRFGVSFWTSPYSLKAILEEKMPAASSFLLSCFSASAASILMFLALFQDTSVFNDTAYISREITKGTYTVGSLYTSMLAVELLLNTVKVTGFIMILFAYNIIDFTYPSVYLYLTLGVFGSKVLCVLFLSISPQGLLSNILVAVKIVVWSLCGFGNICSYGELLEGTPLYPIMYLKVLLFLWSLNFMNSAFFTHFLGIGEALYTNAVAGLKKDDKMRAAYTVSFTVLGHLSSFKTYNTGYLRSWLYGTPYPAYMDFVFAAASVVMAMGLALFILRWKFAPALRLVLTK